MSTERRITVLERVLLRLGHIADLEARAVVSGIGRAVAEKNYTAVTPVVAVLGHCSRFRSAGGSLSAEIGAQQQSRY